MPTSYLMPQSGLDLYRGSSRTMDLAVVDENGDPQDLTGSKLFFTVKLHETDELSLIQKTSDASDEIEIVSALEGLARVYIVPDDTKTLMPREYVFDVWIQLPSGSRHVVIPPSTFLVNAAVTTF